MRLPSRLALSALLAVTVTLAPACERKPTSAAQPVTQQPAFEIPSEGAQNVVSKPSKAEMDKLESVFQECVDLVAQADRFRQEGISIQQSQGRDAANAKLRKAKDLYRKAYSLMEEEIEPDLGAPFTAEQVDKYLRSYTREMGKWSKKASSMGKIND